MIFIFWFEYRYPKEKINWVKIIKWHNKALGYTYRDQEKISSFLYLPSYLLNSNVLTALIIGIITGNKRFDTWLIQIIGPIYDPQSVFFRTEKKAFYANWIGFTNLNSVWTGKKSVFCNPVLPYPIPSYQIPSLPHPTRILNTILHLYKILLPYTTLSYHIEIEPNRPTAETSLIGTPSKFTQAEKSRPKWPKLLFAQPKCWNHLDWFTVPFFG